MMESIRTTSMFSLKCGIELCSEGMDPIIC